MRVFVFVNQVQEIGFRQTTALLIAAFYRQGHDVFLADVDGLTICGSQNYLSELSYTSESHSRDQPANSCGNCVLAKSVQLKLESTNQANSNQVSEFAKSIQDSHFEPVEIHSNDLILIRTNPGRDIQRLPQHRTFLELCQVAKSSGIQIINDPEKLSFFASKASVNLLPAKYRPEMMLSHDPSLIASFIKQANCDCVVKPLLGSRGQDVVRVNAQTNDIEKTLSRFNGQSIVVQHFITSGEPGDKRVVVFDGQLINHAGHFAGIHRLPPSGDFRANLHVGGTAQPLALTTEQQEAVMLAAQMLRGAGIKLAGVDLVGSKVIEFNVFSTGGMYDANQFAGFDFAEAITKMIVESG